MEAANSWAAIFFTNVTRVGVAKSQILLKQLSSNASISCKACWTVVVAPRHPWFRMSKRSFAALDMSDEVGHCGADVLNCFSALDGSKLTTMKVYVPSLPTLEPPISRGACQSSYMLL